MVAGQREVHRVVEQVHAVDAVVLRRPWTRTRSRGRARRCAAAAAVLGLGQLIDSSTPGWCSRKRAIAERHQRRAGGLERRHAQAPAAQAGDRLELGLGLGEARHDRLGVADDRLARLGQAHAARVALHEGRAGLALERGDLLRHGGLGEGQRLGGGGEGAAHRDLAEHAHAADVEHQQNLYHPFRTFI